MLSDRCIVCRADHLASALCQRCAATLGTIPEPEVDWSDLAGAAADGPAAALALRCGAAVPLVSAGAHSIGRDASSAIRLDGPQISARHAEIRRADGGWEIRDVGSENGTGLDAEPLEPNSWRPLHHGEVVSFAGDLEVFFAEVEERDVAALLDEDAPKSNRELSGEIDRDAANVTLALSLEGFRDGSGRALILDGRRQMHRLRLKPPEFALFALLLRRRKGETSVGAAAAGFVAESEIYSELSLDAEALAEMLRDVRARFADFEIANPIESRAARGLRIRHPLARRRW